MHVMNEHTTGCLIGVAIGDAMGADTEFLNIAEILRRYPPDGPQTLQGDPALITDDTQMMLAVADAIVAAGRPLTQDRLEKPLVDAFLAWYHAPDNNRAPGNTCLNACHDLDQGTSWLNANRINSKGCGANMRVMAVGALSLAAPQRAGLAQYQAAITHGHPSALAAADLTAYVIADLLATQDASGLLARAQEYANAQRKIYHADWLGDLWMRAPMPSAQEYIAHGWDECLALLKKVADAVAKHDTQTDPCLLAGAGWVADEAFATGLLCFLLNPTDSLWVVRRAALTSGDSDSIACIAGAFAGAYNGLSGWPEDWVQRVEHSARILEVSKMLAEL
jgi:ADP-ribosylglycohydrolase